jgi:hypothetical protein
VIERSLEEVPVVEPTTVERWCRSNQRARDLAAALVAGAPVEDE